MYVLYLEHSGIPNMRWGIRRFQNKDGTLTPAGKARYAKKPRHQASEARKKAKAEEDARKFEEKRQKALKSGNATEVLKYKEHSTRAELDEALNRIRTERSLAEISAKETAKGKAVFDKVLDFADKWRDRGEKLKKLYNFTADIHNSFVDEDDAWQKLGEANKKAEKARKEEERKAKEKKDKAEADEKAERRKIAAEAAIYKDTGKSVDDLLKIADNLSAKDLKAGVDYMDAEKKKAQRDKDAAAERERRARASEAKRAKSEKDAEAARAKEERTAKEAEEARKDAATRYFYARYGTVKDIEAHKSLFTNSRAYYEALNAAREREEEKKKK